MFDEENALYIRQNDEGLWEEQPIYAEVIYETDEDFNRMQEAVRFYENIKAGTMAAVNLEALIKSLDNLVPIHTNAGAFINKDDVIRMIRKSGEEE